MFANTAAKCLNRHLHAELNISLYDDEGSGFGIFNSKEQQFARVDMSILHDA